MKDLTIIVPVFNATEVTLRCIRSLLQSDARDATILILDDGSIEATRLQLIEAVKESLQVQVTSHWRNRGYTRNINMGLRMTKTPFVCILNSDTQVPRSWAGKLTGVLRRYPHVAAVGPLSNAASYQSIPQVFDDKGGFSTNSDLGALDDERESINGLLSETFQDVFSDVPILNGFCTVFRTEDVRTAGFFDEELFPYGYGEENDLCLRLTGLGRRLYVDVSTFVYHAKSQSFGEEQKKVLSAKGSAALAERYGSATMAAISRQLKDNSILAIVRHVVERYRASSTFSCAGNRQSVDKNAVPSGVPIGARMVTVTGPTIMFESGGKLHTEDMVEYAGSPRLGLSGDAKVVFTVPKGTRVVVDTNDPEWSFLINAALLSYTSSVYVDGSLLSRADILSKLNCHDLPFGMLYLASTTFPSA